MINRTGRPRFRVRRSMGRQTGRFPGEFGLFRSLDELPQAAKRTAAQRHS